MSKDLDPKALEAAVTIGTRAYNDRVPTHKTRNIYLDGEIAKVAFEAAISAYFAALPQAEPVGYVDRLSLPWGIRDREEPGFEMPVFASPTPAVSREVTEEMADAFMVSYYGPSWRKTISQYLLPHIKAALTAALSQPHSEK